MLKAYAVAVVLATTAPVAVKSVEGSQAPAKTETTSQLDTTKNGIKTGTIRFYGIKTGTIRF
ncbi:hypothetical protein [Paraglaciecola sp.]|uniref:hypothetical protein n=1 Tax=Paraglaciecola sp. TaxID=1920173 RepID=UPI00273EDF69|nr:hypothetical protein [Paraglaciecola sp.]MDP5029235.1 hypothetical protein [Paraglaciecola sp.]